MSPKKEVLFGITIEDRHLRLLIKVLDGEKHETRKEWLISTKGSADKAIERATEFARGLGAGKDRLLKIQERFWEEYRKFEIATSAKPKSKKKKARSTKP